MVLARDQSDTAASVLERCTEEILAAYEASLHSTHSFLLREESDIARYLSEARQVLVHVTAELRHGTYLPHGAQSPATPGTAPGGPRTHPVDSGRAAAVLFDAVVAVLLDEFGRRGAPATGAAVLFSLLHRKIVARHTSRAVAHIGSLIGHIHRAHNKERRRISRELHDEVAGYLGSALSSLEVYDLCRHDRPVKARKSLESASDAIRESLASLRGVMSGLRRRIDVAPLRTALAGEVQDAGDHGAEVRVTVTGDESRIPAGVADELFLVLREAQRNAVRHARAGLITVTVHVAPGEVRATVEDDGIGFDPRSPVPRGHSGILSMRERAELLGGSVTVDSHPGCGTRILLLVPLAEEGDGDARA